jgi:hypothetical protein
MSVLSFLIFLILKTFRMISHQGSYFQSINQQRIRGSSTMNKRSADITPYGMSLEVSVPPKKIHKKETTHIIDYSMIFVKYILNK